MFAANTHREFRMITLYELAGADPALRFSPYCWRVRMALAHKGLEATTIPWRFHEKARLPGAPANTRVPILVDGSKVVAESQAIAFHLESRYANGPSLFGGAGGEAHARFILAWADNILIPAMAPIVAPAVLPLLHPDDRAYFRASREARFGTTLEDLAAKSSGRLAGFHDVLTPLRKTLSQQPFLGGDEPSYADYGVFGAFQWASCVGAPELLAADDALMGWRETMLDLFDGLAGQAVTAKEVQS
jgi:glutathione S-transferase